MKSRFTAVIITISILLFFTALNLPVIAGEIGGGTETSGNRFVVRLREGKSVLTLQQAQPLGLQVKGTLSHEMLLVEAPSGMDQDDLARLPDVLWAEPDLPFYAAGTPNDPDYPKQWNLEKIGMSQAWDIEAGGKSSVVIAVVDSGAAYRDSGKFSKA